MSKIERAVIYFLMFVAGWILGIAQPLLTRLFDGALMK